MLIGVIALIPTNAERTAEAKQASRRKREAQRWQPTKGRRRRTRRPNHGGGPLNGRRRDRLRLPAHGLKDHWESKRGWGQSQRTSAEASSERSIALCNSERRNAVEALKVREAGQWAPLETGKCAILRDNAAELRSWCEEISGTESVPPERHRWLFGARVQRYSLEATDGIDQFQEEIRVHRRGWCRLKLSGDLWRLQAWEADHADSSGRARYSELRNWAQVGRRGLKLRTFQTSLQQWPWNEKGIIRLGSEWEIRQEVALRFLDRPFDCGWRQSTGLHALDRSFCQSPESSSPWLTSYSSDTRKLAFLRRTWPNESSTLFFTRQCGPGRACVW